MPPGTPAMPETAGSSSILNALGGIWVGMIRPCLKICDTMLTVLMGLTTGPRGGAGGGGPGAAMVAIHAARGSTCGEIMGASTAPITSNACPATPANVVQTRFDTGP